MTLKTTNALIGFTVAAIVAVLAWSQPRPPLERRPAPPPQPTAAEVEATASAETAAFAARWPTKTAYQRVNVRLALEQASQLKTLERVGADRKTKCLHAQRTADAWLAAAEDILYRAAAQRAAEWCS